MVRKKIQVPDLSEGEVMDLILLGNVEGASYDEEKNMVVLPESLRGTVERDGSLRNRRGNDKND